MKSNKASNREKMETSIEITQTDESIEDGEDKKAFLNTTEKQKTDNPTQNVESIQRNLRELGRLDRFTTGTTENCFMPILQLLLIFPILLKCVEEANEQKEAKTPETLLKAAQHWLRLFYTLISICTSLIGLSSTALDLHFSREKKQFSRNKKTAKITFVVATTFQTISRLLIIIGFVLVVWKDVPFAPFAPLFSFSSFPPVFSVTASSSLVLEQQPNNVLQLQPK